MSSDYFFKKINYHDRKDRERFVRSVADVFMANGSRMERIRKLAVEVSGLIEDLSPFIQQNTEEICPSCQKVCCINKHSYYEHEDIVYIHALGEEMLPLKDDLIDTSPCQFLGEYGCTIRRSVRPYRCNWYFCTPLLEHIQNRPAPVYRSFTKSLQQITEKRADLLDEFIKVARKL